MSTITLRKDTCWRRVIGLTVVCALFLFLPGCSDEQGKSDTPAAPKGTTQPSPAPPQTPPAPQAATPAGGSGACSALLTAKCVECHTVARICEKIGKKSKSRWQRTLDRMVERGAKMTPEESAALLVCLENGATNDLQGACK